MFGKAKRKITEPTPKPPKSTAPPPDADPKARGTAQVAGDGFVRSVKKTAAELGLEIRPVKESELGDVEALVREEGWRYTAGDLKDWLELYPSCMFGGFIKGKLIASAMSLPMDDSHGYISSLIVHKDHRKQGVGTLMYERARDNRTLSLAGQIVYLTAPNDTETMFERWGYTFSRHQVYTCEGLPHVPPHYAPPTHLRAEPVTFDNLHAVLELEGQVSPTAAREHVWRHFLKSKNTVAVKCIMEKDEVTGLLMLRKEDATAMRISAFYAENYDIARALLYDAIKNHVPPETSLVSWFSIVNIDRCRKLYKEFGLDDPEYWGRGMFTKEESKVPWFKVYSIFEFYTWLV